MERQLMGKVGRGTLATRDWDDPWYYYDYSADKADLLRLSRHQSDTHGSFDIQGLLAAAVMGDDVLINADPTSMTTKDFAGVAWKGNKIGDVLEVERIGSFRVRFRSLRLAYPLAPGAAQSFRRLCDTVVYNYPAVLAPQDPLEVVHVTPATTDVWRLERGTRNGLRHIWEPNPVARFSMGPVTTAQDITPIVRKTIDDPTARAQDHQWLGPATAPFAEDQKGSPLRVGQLHHRNGCPHCPTARNRGKVNHIFWECPAAQQMWQVVQDGWGGHQIWETRARGADFKEAVFDMRLPHFPHALWALADLAAISTKDEDGTNEVHQTAQVAWQQQVIETLLDIWRWRYNIKDEEQQWTRERAQLYLSGVLRATLRGLGGRLPPTTRLRDPRRQLLATLEQGFRGDETRVSTVPTVHERHILFFDGGSRGNPGPGGAGVVIVATDEDAVTAQVVCSAAEYLGLITGLQAAQDNNWQVEVVGDSSFILRQVREYRPPKNGGLQPLYNTARRLADAVRVRVWEHHVRAYNKMADCAANIAMDTHTSAQVHHPSSWPHTATIESHLETDFDEWRTRHIQRLCRV